MDRNLRIQLVLNAIDKVTSPLRNIAGSSSKAGAEMSATRERLKALNATSQNIAGFRQLRQDVQATSERMRAAQNRATQLGRELAQTSAPTRKMQQEFRRAKREAEELAGRHQKQTLALRELRSKLSEAGISTRDLVRHERDLRQQIGRTNAELDQQSERLQRLSARDQRLAAGRAAYSRVQGVSTNMAVGGATSMATGAAVLAPLKAMAQESMQFEDAMADVRKVVDFDTPAQFKGMSEDILALSERLPMAATGIAQIVAAGGQANIPREELMGFAEDATKMGIAFDTTAEKAGDRMAKWRTAFGMGREEVIALADQVNYLGNTTTAGVDAISGILTRIGPLGEIGGIAARSIAALGATISSMGVSEEIAATGIKNMTLAMTKGSAATKSQQKAWRQLGLSATSVATGMQEDADATILTVLERMQSVPKEAQAGLLTQLFGAESVSAIAPLLTQLDTLKENFDKVGDASQYAGSMEAEYVARSETTSNAVQLADNAFRNLQNTLGQTLQPTIQALANRMGAMSARFRAWAKENPTLARTVILMAAGLGALLVVFGGLAIAAAGLVAPFAALSFAATALNIGLLPLMAIALGVMAALAALVAGGYWLYKNWERIKAWWNDFWAGFPDAFYNSVIAITRTLVNFSPVGLLYAGFAKLMSWLGVDIPAQLSTVGADLIRGLWKGISSREGPFFNWLRNLAKKIPAPIRKALGIKSPSRVFMGIGGDIMDGLDAGLGAGARAPLARVSDLSGQLTRALVVGATAPALLAASPAGATPAGPLAPIANALPASGNTYNLTINVNGPSNPADIERAVRNAIEQIERERMGRSFGDR